MLDLIDAVIDRFFELQKVPPDVKGIEFFNDSEYCVHEIRRARLDLRQAMSENLKNYIPHP